MVDDISAMIYHGSDEKAEEARWLAAWRDQDAALLIDGADGSRGTSRTAATWRDAANAAITPHAGHRPSLSRVEGEGCRCGMADHVPCGPGCGLGAGRVQQEDPRDAVERDSELPAAMAGVRREGWRVTI